MNSKLFKKNLEVWYKNQHLQNERSICNISLQINYLYRENIEWDLGIGLLFEEGKYYTAKPQDELLFHSIMLDSVHTVCSERFCINIPYLTTGNSNVALIIWFIGV